MGYTDEHDILLGLEYAPAPNDLPSSQTRRISDTVSHLYRLALALRYPAGTEYLKSVEYRIFTAAQELEKHVVDHHNVSDDISTLKTISEACADPQDPPSPFRCTLCQCICPSQRHWFKHLHEHQAAACSVCATGTPPCGRNG